MYPTISVFSLPIPTYYLILSFTVCVALIWATKRAEAFHLSRKMTLDLGLIIMVFGFIGARLFHVFYEDFEYYQKDFLRILQFWNGGYVFYGGALFAGLVAILYVEFQEKNQIEKYLDLFAPVMALSYIFGRGACFLAGCCYGRVCELPWSIVGRHPTQIYAMMWELGVLALLLGREQNPVKKNPPPLQQPGAGFYLWIILHGLGRLMMEAFRDDFRGPSLGLSVSSWISIAVILLGLIFMFRKRNTVS